MNQIFLLFPFKTIKFQDFMPGKVLTLRNDTCSIVKLCGSLTITDENNNSSITVAMINGN